MIDTRALVDRLRTIESVALIPRVASTNLVARRVVSECIENELSLPQAMIVAGEQFAGRGRNQRSWSSPAGKGIYATTLLTRATEEIGLVPLSMATIVARYVIDVFGAPAGIKWPNDILVSGRKVAGILIEGRIQEDRAYLAIGTGVNLEPVATEDRPNATSIQEVAPGRYRGVEEATIAFIEHVDAALSLSQTRDAVLADWRALAIHRTGDPITCVVGERTFAGTWEGIDEQGRARLATPSGDVTVSAGDLIVM